MAVKLKVLHGALKKNNQLQVVVPITKTPFVIGRTSDCDMRCHSQAISRRHCEIRVSGMDIWIVDLNSRNGVRVNDKPVQDEHRLVSGDRFAIGRLDFELIVEMPARRAGYDPVGDFICEMLLDGDQREAENTTSELQWYKIEPVDPYEGMSAREKLQAKRRKNIQNRHPHKDFPHVSRKVYKARAVQTLARYGQGLEKCYRRSTLAASQTETIDLSSRTDNDVRAVPDSGAG